MNRRLNLFTRTCVLCLLAAATCLAQRRGRDISAAPAIATWENDPEFKHDVFTFARIQYDSASRRRGSDWDNDFPDCDLNFSLRLRQLTSFQVNPETTYMRLTDPTLFNYPFVYMSNVGYMMLSDAEASGMRRYLLNGGFVMADDFWTPGEWRHVKDQMKMVFPDREPRELTLDHEIFNLVYKIKSIPQVPSIFAWRDGYMYEPWHGDYEGDEEPHFWGYFDDEGRLMALMCMNNDIGDGWEREGENSDFFELFSKQKSYPLGINIVTYAMTH